MVDTIMSSVKAREIDARNFKVHLNSKCEQTRLSNQFDLKIDFNRFSDTAEMHDSCVLKVLLKNKMTKTSVDSIFLTSFFYFGNKFKNCDSSTTSFTTGFNAKRKIYDNYFGDLVVCDLNFDNKDDIAILNDDGGNGGPLYSYFIQGENNKFTLDNFLTDSVMYFPTTIDKFKQQLVTYVHAGACCVGKQVYKFNTSKKTWKQTQHKILGYQ